MAVIKITDIAYGRLRAPDLDVMEEFLTHFGLVKAERTNNALYMRGSDPAHHIHITEKGEPKFLGAAFYARNLDDLKKLAKLPGASGIETMDEPGGGKRVRLKEPNGFQIEVVHGIRNLKQLNVKLVSVDEPMLDDSPMGKLASTMATAFGEFYSHNLSSRVRYRFQHHREQGRWLHAAPIGYRNVQSNGKTLAFDDSAPLVRQAFEMMATGGHSSDHVRNLVTAAGLRSIDPVCA